MQHRRKSHRRTKLNFGDEKLNIDVSFYVDGFNVVVAVLSDHRGGANSGIACTLDHMLNATSTEILALL
jgi:hypothetical protein